MLWNYFHLLLKMTTDSEKQSECGVVNVDERVQEALAAVHTISSEVNISIRPTDQAEGELISDFLTSGCGCKKAGGKACSFQRSTLPQEGYLAWSFPMVSLTWPLWVS